MSVAGSKGGVVGKLINTNYSLKDFVKNFEEIVIKYDLVSVRNISLYVNNKCNLACSYCYFQNKPSEGILLEEDFSKILPIIKNNQIKLLTFAGKEVFLPSSQERTLKFMKILSSYDKLKFGVVSNGTNFDEKLIKNLKKLKLGFVDISIDSYDEKINNITRGNGSYMKCVDTLRKLSSNNIAEGNIYVAVTLTKINIESFFEIFNFSKQFKINHYSIMPVLAYSDKVEKLSISDLGLLFNRLEEKAIDFFNERTILIFDIDSNVVINNLEFFSKKFEESVFVDDANQIFLIKQIGKLSVFLRIELPDPCNALATISYNGFYFDKGGCLIMNKNNEKYALNHLKEIPIEKLVKEHEIRAKNIIKDYSSNLLSFIPSEFSNKIERTSFYKMPRMLKK